MKNKLFRAVTLAFLLCLCSRIKGESNVPRVTAVPRWPWNGLVDITISIPRGIVTQNGAPVGFFLQLEGMDNLLGKPIDIHTISPNGGAFVYYSEGRELLGCSSNVCRLVWDASKDYPTLNTSNFTVKVAATPILTTYMVVNLQNGTWMFTDTPPNLADDACRTTELWLRWIPAGTFTMGSPENELGRNGDEIQHQVTLTHGFFIGIFEITRMQYILITYGWHQGDMVPFPRTYNEIRGASLGAGWPSGGHAVDDGSFLGKLRAKTGLEFDLPTEAQWEYACRAGTTTALNSGKNLTSTDICPNMAEVGRYYGNRGDGRGGYDVFTKVGSYRPNAWGLYDMHGNLKEWCLDWYGGYPTEASTDPRGADTGSNRVLRGGEYNYRALPCRSAYRDSNPPNSGGNGFRVVCRP